MRKLTCTIFLSLFTIVIIISSCEKQPDTGLEGIVYRGPINPVEVVGVPNDEPFAAEFKVLDDNLKNVKSFSSNEDGEYSVFLEPGVYIIIPGLDAPLLMPGQQGKTVTVDPTGITYLDLYFDTGIR